MKRRHMDHNLLRASIIADGTLLLLLLHHQWVLQPEGSIPGTCILAQLGE